MLLRFIVATILLISIPIISAYDYNDYSLHRIARAPHVPSALLVPYPRVGKRNAEKPNHNVANVVQPEMHKRFYMARVGKRSYYYNPRIGK